MLCAGSCWVPNILLGLLSLMFQVAQLAAGANMPNVVPTEHGDQCETFISHIV